MTDRNRDATAILLAGIAASAVGALFYNLMPAYLGAAQDSRGLNTGQVGLIGTSFFTGFTLTTAFGFFWIRRVDWRLTSSLAAAVAAVGLSLGAASDSYPLLLAGVFLAGGALSAIYGIGATAIGDTSNPARWFGFKIAAEAGTGAALLALLPALVIARWGLSGLVWTMVAAILLSLPALLLLPRGGPVTEDPDGRADPSRKTDRMAVGLALAGCLLFMCGETVVWSFLERLGAHGGYDPVAVGRLLAATLMLALTGSFAAAALGGRLGSLLPLLAAHACFLAAIAVLSRAASFPAYATGACLVMFSVGLGLPFAMTSVAALDHDGRHVVLTVPAIGVGMLIAPGMAGWLVSDTSYGPVLLFGALCLGGSLVTFLMASIRRRALSTRLRTDG